jgi:hypothetical protein
MKVQGKRYLVFAGERFPAGGWDDLVLATNDVEEAVAFAENSLMGDEFKRWADVIDTTVGLKVWSKGFSYGRNDAPS